MKLSKPVYIVITVFIIIPLLLIAAIKTPLFELRAEDNGHSLDDTLYLASNKFLDTTEINDSKTVAICSIDTLRHYSSESEYNRVVIRRNKKFAEQVNRPNTIYIIKYEYDLMSQKVTFPNNCILRFDGGRLKNGTIDGNGLIIESPQSHIFESDLTIRNVKGDLHSSWFGALRDGVTDDSHAFNKMFSAAGSGNKLVFDSGVSICKNQIRADRIHNFQIDATGCQIKYAQGASTLSVYPFLFDSCFDFSINNLSIDAQHEVVIGIRLFLCEGFRLSNVKVQNCGSSLEKGQAHGIGLAGCRNGFIFEPVIEHMVLSEETGNAASGIFISAVIQDNVLYEPNNIVIDGAYINDIQPFLDGDGIKVLNSKGGDANIVVKNSIFRDCKKRAMKFQAKGCRSKNNTAYFTNSAPFAFIDFQRGEGSSLNDKAFFSFIREDQHHLLYSAYYVTDGNVTIDSAQIIKENVDVTSIDNYHGSISSYFLRIGTADKTNLGNIVVKNVYSNAVSGFSIMPASKKPLTISSLMIDDVQLDLRGSGAGFNYASAHTIKELAIDNFRIVSSGNEEGHPQIIPVCNIGKASIHMNDIPRRFGRDGLLMLRDAISTCEFKGEQCSNLNGDVFVIEDGRVVFYSDKDIDPNKQIYSSGNNFRYAKEGDLCIIQQDTLVRKFICTEAPSSKHVSGVWKEMQEDDSDTRAIMKTK